MTNVERKLNALIIGGEGSAGVRHRAAQERLGNNSASYDTILGDRAEARVGDKIEALSLEEALDWADVVHICTPDHLHTDYAIQAVESDNTVLIEKPVATNLSDARQIEESSRNHSGETFVGSNYRLTPTFLAIRDSVRDGRLGSLYSVESSYLHDMREYRQKTPWREDQNFLYGGGVHAVDLAHWLVQDDVESVKCTLGPHYSPDYNKPEDYHITLSYQNGVIADIYLNARLPQPEHGSDLAAKGTEGFVRSHNKWTHMEEFIPSLGIKTLTKSEIGTAYTFDEEIRVIDQWMRGLKQDHDPVPNIHEANGVMTILDAIERSASENETVYL